jgi:hypothetical protein
MFFNNKIEPSRVLVSEGHYWKATNTSEEMLHMAETWRVYLIKKTFLHLTEFSCSFTYILESAAAEENVKYSITCHWWVTGECAQLHFWSQSICITFVPLSYHCLKFFNVFWHLDFKFLNMLYANICGQKWICITWELGVVFLWAFR